MPSADTQTIALLLGAINHLQSQLLALEERCRNLEEKASKNSSNSSKPPSSDGYQKSNTDDKNNVDSPNPKSLRQPSGLKAGGQKKHKGYYVRLKNLIIGITTRSVIARCAVLH